MSKLSKVKKMWPKPGLRELANIHGLDPIKIKWSKPMVLKRLAEIFDVHRNTMKGWLKDQVICNQQMSARRWRVAMYEFPNGFG